MWIYGCLCVPKIGIFVFLNRVFCVPKIGFLVNAETNVGSICQAKKESTKK